MRGCAFSGVMRRGSGFAFSMLSPCVATGVGEEIL